MSPVRTCVGCRARVEQDEMVRIAVGLEGPAVGRSVPGRGAWVHRRCIDAAVAKGRLARALRAGLSEAEIARLRSDIGKDGAT